MNDFEAVWARIRGCAGQEFRTVRGLPFTYTMSGDYVQPSRTNVELPKVHFRSAYDMMPLSGPGSINRLVMGPAYIFAILTDERIKS
ncbi:MAG TPA: hypothetical protein VJ820_09635 [Propionibacteriaceae bacterium]|nr:hypothetical protein [Propionibacteriaceae bacterium]